jgi:pyrrolidone-carboxylate peptidase
MLKKAIITGSETFGKYIMNPSKWLALSANGKIVAGYEIHSLVFPSVVSVSKGAENPGEIIIRKAQEINADIIISFGLASGVKGFRLERSGSNWIHNEKYLSAIENNQPLDPSRPEKEQIQSDLSCWDIEKMQNLFAQAGIPFESKISDDPGQYSCNGWIYRTLLAMKKKQLNTPYLFVHSACTEEAIELISDFDTVNKLIIKKEDMLKALEIIIQSYKGQHE